jgi:hypothetical protein
MPRHRWCRDFSLAACVNRHLVDSIEDSLRGDDGDRARVHNRGDLFAEYVGDYTKQDRSSQIVDVGGGWHLTPTQRVDFHLGAGLTRIAPRHYVGLGDSFRFDGVLARQPGSAQVSPP